MVHVPALFVPTFEGQGVDLVHLHGRENAVEDLTLGDLISCAQDVRHVLVHDCFLASHLLEVLQRPLAAGFEVDVPRQRCAAAHHAPADAALVLQGTKEEVEIVHPSKRHDAKARHFQGPTGVAVAIGREEVVLDERLDRVDGAGVLEHVILELVEPVFTVEPHDIEGTRFGESQCAGDVGWRNRQLGRPGHDVALLTPPDGFLAAVGDCHCRTGVLAPLVVLDGDDPVTFGSELAPHCESRRSNSLVVHHLSQLVAGFGVGHDDETFDVVRAEDVAECFGGAGELAHVVRLGSGAGLEQTGDDGGHLAFLQRRIFNTLPYGKGTVSRFGNATYNDSMFLWKSQW